MTLKAEHPFYTEYIVPAGTYTGVDKDVTTLAVKATFIVSDKLDEATVYEMTKALFENKDALAQAHAKGKEIDATYAVDGISIPFHPGAIKYFKEIGVLD